MDEFLKDRERETKALAIIDYFKLIKLAELTKKEKTETFVLLDGYNIINRLLNKTEEGYFDITKTITELYTELFNYIDEINYITLSKSKVTDIINNEGSIIMNEFANRLTDELAIDLLLNNLSFNDRIVCAHSLLELVLRSNKSKTKKI